MILSGAFIGKELALRDAGLAGGEKNPGEKSRVRNVGARVRWRVCDVVREAWCVT